MRRRSDQRRTILMLVFAPWGLAVAGAKLAVEAVSAAIERLQKSTLD